MFGGGENILVEIRIGKHLAYGFAIRRRVIGRERDNSKLSRGFETWDEW